MFNDFLTRLIAAVGVFLAGLHVIGWGMTENGSAHPRNPIWRSLSAFFAFELDALKFLGWVALSLTASFIVIRVVLGLRTTLSPEESSDSMREVTKYASTSIPTYSSVLSTGTGATAMTATPLPERRPEMAMPRPTPTPEELKKKAIEQILKGV